jgi:hypothetical protein
MVLLNIVRVLDKFFREFYLSVHNVPQIWCGLNGVVYQVLWYILVDLQSDLRKYVYFEGIHRFLVHDTHHLDKNTEKKRLHFRKQKNQSILPLIGITNLSNKKLVKNKLNIIVPILI